MIFYPGLHHAGDAQHFERCCISIRTLWGRIKPIECDDVFVDSGAFREIELHGGYNDPVSVYAAELYRLHTSGIVKIAVAVAQDYMCEPFMLAKTGLTIADHQRLTIERYDALKNELDRLYGGRCPFPVMPVLQGYAPEDYSRHVRMYGDRLMPGMWVGVGSVCKRNGSPQQIFRVLRAILNVRPDLLLHGFGVKKTSLDYEDVRSLLHSSDSMAWSFAARYEGRNGNDWREARDFVARLNLSDVSTPAKWWCGQPELFDDPPDPLDHSTL